MPICGRIRGFERFENDGYSFRFTVHEYSREIPLRDYVARAFPKAFVQNYDPSLRSFIVSASRHASAEEIEAFLDLLRTSVTILDDADESHALGMHWYKGDGRTSLGDLVYGAKYGSEPVSRFDHARALGRRCARWLAAHPRYRNADCIAAIPSSGPASALDLPNILVEEITKAFRLERIPMSTAPRTQQKGLGIRDARENVHGKFSVQRRLSGRTVVLLDDLYDSGSTINEGVRALRSASAHAVFALTASKTSEYCEGLWAYAYNWEIDGGDQ